MKTVKEVAIENCGCQHMNCKYCMYYDRMYECPSYKKKVAFEEGAQFAQRWIPIDECLPEQNGCKILVKSLSERVYLSYYLNGKFTSNAKITHWRPIELVFE